MFNLDRRLRDIERALVAIAQKLDISIEIGLTDLALERESMANAADVRAKTDALIAKVQANTDATASIAQWASGLKAQLADLQTQLEAAVAAGNPAEIEAASANLDAAIASIDADTVAEAALVNTPAAPTE